MTRRVWIVQCLCPGRHCIMAVVGEAEDAEAEAVVEAPLRRSVEGLIEAGVQNPWCGLCGAKAETWRYERRPSQFATMAEAEAVMRQVEAENLATAALFGDMPRDRLH